jgi:UDP-N-acetylglucosamine 2-epimerase (non-hydrolysing)
MKGADMVNLDIVAAARPNFMKVAPLLRALKDESWCRPRLVHTGQHYDQNMSDTFFRDLKLPEPDIHLGIGGGTHAEQTAGVMVAYERECMKSRPDWVIVVGDVNSTIACTLAAKKLLIPVAHLEAGLRSGDRTMPEELNRLATDALADLLWTPSIDADQNLLREGVDRSRIEMVGNIMIDSLEMVREKIEARRFYKSLGVQAKEYAVATFHRPSNVDDKATLTTLAQVLGRIGNSLTIVFPVHPRTKQRLMGFGLWEPLTKANGVVVTDPLGYIDFMSLIFGCKCALTDSGGIQEETTYLGIPCFTMRTTTERPITITHGTNRLVSIDAIEGDCIGLNQNDQTKNQIPKYWDGKTAIRVVRSIKRRAGHSKEA